MDQRWLLNFRNRPDRKVRWWAIAATGDLDLALREFKRECEEDDAERERKTF